MSEYKSGFVAIIGRPNVGKSTLLNSLLKQKVVIVSAKPQTTRNTIRAVLTKPEGQIIFIDTPGIHQPRHKLGEYMVRSARATFNEVDLVCLVVDLTRWQDGDDYILSDLADLETPVFLIANKADLVSEDQQKDFLANAKSKYKFREMVAVSAQEGTNLDSFTEKVLNYLPPGPQYYPEDWLTDYPERFVIAEFIREQIIVHTQEEIPHAVAIDVDEIDEQPDKNIVKVRATIYVERNSQKGIIIGKDGAMLKSIGSLARHQMEILLGTRVFLQLWVKVKKDWRNKPGSLSEFGYN